MKRYTLPCVMLLVLGGCASPTPPATETRPLSWVPDPQPFPPSAQLVAKAAGHWSDIAADVAGKLVERISRIEGTKGLPIQVAPPSPDSAFGQAFHDFLVTELVNRGLLVSKSAQDGFRLDHHVQLVRSAAQPEAIVTTTIYHNERYLVRSSDVYYVDEAASYTAAPQRNNAVLHEYRIVGAGK